MRQSDLDLEKYWVSQSGYFILVTSVTLGVGITDGKLLYCHGVTEVNVYRKVSTLQYNNRTVYDCFSNTFTYQFGGTDLNLPPIAFDDRPCPLKMSFYTPDLLPAAIYVALENYVITLTIPSDLLDLLPSNYPNNIHVMKMGVPV